MQRCQGKLRFRYSAPLRLHLCPHNGSALSLEEVMERVEHRTSGTSGVDQLSNADDWIVRAEFLKSIDATTEPFQSQ
jgi:hypothetical protein